MDSQNHDTVCTHAELYWAARCILMHFEGCVCNNDVPFLTLHDLLVFQQSQQVLCSKPAHETYISLCLPRSFSSFAKYLWTWADDVFAIEHECLWIVIFTSVITVMIYISPTDVSPVLSCICSIAAEILLNSQQLVVLGQSLRSETQTTAYHTGSKAALKQGPNHCLSLCDEKIQTCLLMSASNMMCHQWALRSKGINEHKYQNHKDFWTPPSWCSQW